MVSHFIISPAQWQCPPACNLGSRVFGLALSCFLKMASAPASPATPNNSRLDKIYCMQFYLQPPNSYGPQSLNCPHHLKFRQDLLYTALPATVKQLDLNLVIAPITSCLVEINFWYLKFRQDLQYTALSATVKPLDLSFVITPNTSCLVEIDFKQPYLPLRSSWNPILESLLKWTMLHKIVQMQIQA